MTDEVIRFGIEWKTLEFEVMVTFVDPRLARMARIGWEMRASDHMPTEYQKRIESRLTKLGLKPKGMLKVVEISRS